MLELITLITFYGSLIAVVAYFVAREDKKETLNREANIAFQKVYQQREQAEFKKIRIRNKKELLKDLKSVKSNQWI